MVLIDWGFIASARARSAVVMPPFSSSLARAAVCENIQATRIGVRPQAAKQLSDRLRQGRGIDDFGRYRVRRKAAHAPG